MTRDPREKLEHPFGPLYSEHSRTLILGSFPSVKSREQAFYYGNPHNRFWPVIAAVFGESEPETIEEKKALIIGNDLALWDSISRCEISGSSDASIRNAEPNDIGMLVDRSEISRVFCNGRKAYDLYRKYILPSVDIEAELLPSTSPANAAWTLPKLIGAWSRLREREA